MVSNYKKILLSVFLAFNFFYVSGVCAENSFLEISYLDIPNYPQKNEIVNPIVLSKFQIKNTGSAAIKIESINLYNKGNLNLNKAANIALIPEGEAPILLNSELENTFILDKEFDLEAGESETITISASVTGAKRGEFVKMGIDFNQKDILMSVSNEPKIMAPLKSQLRIIGDVMGDYDIIPGQKNLPLLAFHIQSDEVTFIPTVKLFLDNSIGANISSLEKSFVNFKLFDNERQKFIHPVGNVTTDGLLFTVDSDVWVSGDNYFALFADIGNDPVLDTSIRFKLDESLSIKDALFITTKGDVGIEDMELSGTLGSKVDLVEEANIIEEIPDLPDAIVLEQEERINPIPEELENPLPENNIPEVDVATPQTIDNSDKEALAEVQEFKTEIKEREATKITYLKEVKGISEVEEIVVAEEELDLIDLESLEFFVDTDASSLEGIAAAYLRSLEIIGGYPDGEFKGDRAVNRAEITKFLLLGADKTINEEVVESIFPDVQAGSWYEKYVVTANMMNIVNGYPDGTFKPSKNVNTVEFLKMLTNSFNLEKNLGYMFADVEENQWFVPFVGNVDKFNLFPRRSSSLLEPAKEMTRYEVAVAIYQILVDRLK